MNPTAVNITFEYRLAVAIGEIINDVRKGTVPMTVTSFDELHNFVDPNCYGGVLNDDVMPKLIEHFGGRDEHEGWPEGFHEYFDRLCTKIDEWLKAGGVTNLALLNATTEQLKAEGIRL